MDGIGGRIGFYLVGKLLESEGLIETINATIALLGKVAVRVYDHKIAWVSTSGIGNKIFVDNLISHWSNPSITLLPL